LITESLPGDGRPAVSWPTCTPAGGSRFEWQASYGAFSVSESQAKKVRQYIQTQESHHAKVSFKDELITLLKKHGIEYDERYLLG
jgi:putative transposase